MVRLRRTIGTFILVLGLLHRAHATDDHPGDYVPLPPGTSALVSYSYYGISDGANIGGTNLSGDKTGLLFATEIVRFVHYTKIFGHTVDANLLVPFGGYWSGRIGGLRLNDAFGAYDPILASSVWLLEQPEQGRYFAVTPLLYIPVGSYNTGEALNTGEHRWKGTLEGGWVETLVPNRLTLELNGNVSWFGKNDRAGVGTETLTEQPSFQLQPWLRYNFTPLQAVSLGYFGQFGGFQRIEGVANGFRTDEQAIRLNYQQFLTANLQLSTTVAHDLAVSGGFRQVFLLDVRFALVF
jgi:Putative MetA-pathway of phenol degradation